MNKKTIMILAALGMTQAQNVLADDISTISNTNINDPSIIAESLQINVDTVRVLKMFSDMGALNFDKDGTVFVDPTNLPNFLISKLSESGEVLLDEKNDVFILDDAFVNVLATNHVFTRLGRIDSLTANKTILENLKKQATPVPRRDQVTYAKASFISGN